MATEVFVGDPARFPDGKALASYVGMIPSEHSSGRRQRLGALSKQGNPFLRFLWCGARGTALSRPAEPNALWCADYKGEFMLAVHAFIEQYNRNRPHQGLGMKVPADVYARSARVYRRFCAPGGIRRRLH